MTWQTNQTSRKLVAQLPVPPSVEAGPPLSSNQWQRPVTPGEICEAMQIIFARLMFNTRQCTQQSHPTRIAPPLLQCDTLYGNNPCHRSTTPTYGAEKQRAKACLRAATLIGALRRARSGPGGMRPNDTTTVGCACRVGPGHTKGRQRRHVARSILHQRSSGEIHSAARPRDPRSYVVPS